MAAEAKATAKRSEQEASSGGQSPPYARPGALVMNVSGRGRTELVAGCVLAMVLGTGCGGGRHVSIEYSHRPPRHRHVWVSSYCRDCGWDCDYCSSCDRYRHRTVSVRISDGHDHHWRLRYCDDCGMRCRHCDGCREIRHASVSIRIEAPVHRHHWESKWCKRCRQEHRVCTGCREAKHVPVLKRRPAEKRRAAHQHTWKLKHCKKHQRECRVCTECKKIQHMVGKGKGKTRRTQKSRPRD